MYNPTVAVAWECENNPYLQARCRRSEAAKKINQVAVRKRGTAGGRPPASDEVILRAVLFRLREGCSWRALSMFAPYTTIYTRWKQWCEAGVWGKILARLTRRARGKLWAIDSTCVKVHKHAFGAAQLDDDQSIGRTRGGANTKIHALVDTRGRVVRVLLSAGHRHDILAAPELVAGLCERIILADKAYDVDAFRQRLDSLGLGACIPPKANRVDPSAYHKGHYRRRHKIENFFQRIKELRAIATRYEKLASRFLALVLLASVCDWFAR